MRFLKDFHLISGDFLKLLASEQNKPKAAVLESYFDAMEAIVTQADEAIHAQTLSAINEHAKALILEQELKTVYNELYKKYPDAIDLIASSAIKPKETFNFSKEVNLK